MQLIYSSWLKDLHFNVSFQASTPLYRISYADMLLTPKIYEYILQNLLGNLL